METFNNIWSSITTPNPMAIEILILLFSVLESFILIKLFISLTKTSSSLSKELLYVGLSVIIGFIINSFISPPFNIILNFIVSVVLAFLIFKNSFQKTLFTLIFSLFAMNLIGFLILNPFLLLFNITSIELSSIPLYRALYMLIIYAITLFFIFILKTFNLKLDFLGVFSNCNNMLAKFNISLGILTILTQSITLFYYVDKLPIIITFMNFFFLLSYFSISIYSLIKNNRLFSTKQKLQSATEYNNTLKILHDNIRGFKHDFDNIVTTIGGFVRTNDINGLKEYYLQLEEDCQKVNNLYFLNPELINNDGIYNLLAKKYNDATSKGISVNLSFMLDLSTLNMKIYEFSRILGILIDNAIEASSESSEKIINLSFRNDSKNSRQLIRIENSYNNKDININNIFQKGFSEKKDHSGLGLWEIRKIIKQNNKYNLYTNKNDKLFIQQLELYD